MTSNLEDPSEVGEPLEILLVDDTERNLTALEAILADLDARVLKARSGAEALRCLLRRDFALVLLDVRMRGMNGFETAELIRARDRSRHTPIIFLTAYDRTREHEIRGYALGAVDFLTKPVIPEVLRGKVAALIDLHRKTEAIKRQAALLRESERREHAQLLEHARRCWEQDALRKEMEREREVALERSRLVEELRRSDAELREADARKDEFLAMLGHELRNPLAPVLNAVKLMQQSGAPEPLNRVLHAADRQIGHMTRLLDDLLDLSRIRNGKIELKREAVDLSRVVLDAVHATEGTFQEREQRLELDLPQEPVVFEGDPVRLTQVAANLLHNAAKCTGREGHVALHAGREGAEIVLRVKDDGIGIQPEMLLRIFDMFVQGNQAGDRVRGGLGLGLTLVRSLVELHGGTVVARSAGPGTGSEFEVRLPAAAPAGGREGERPPARAVMAETTAAEIHKAAARPLQIVLVEDNQDIRDSLRALLELKGHRVQEAEDGRAGVDLILSSCPSVALVDIGLPGLDGYQLASELRARSIPTRLVAMTGYGRPEDRRLALQAGFDAHLVKPVDFDDLSRLLDELS